MKHTTNLIQQRYIPLPKKIEKEMKIEELPSYKDVCEYLKKKKRTKHLLLGNGFSMSYDSEIFSYNALYSFIENLDNEVLTKLFNIINTKNFELVMQQIDNFIQMAEAFSSDKSFTEKLRIANKELQESLINAIKELHPEHVFEVPDEKSESCFKYLSDFLDNSGKIFSTNYDLLLYWVLMRNSSKNAIDGFGKELENEEDVKRGAEPEFSELTWGPNKSEQSVFYVHGALHLFDSGIDIIKEIYSNNTYLLENIKKRLDNKHYPIFVTAGNGEEKLNHISHNKYLTDTYDELSSISGSLVTFGFNFGEYDNHIIEALNKASKFNKENRNTGKLFSIYIGVYSESDLKHIESIQDKFDCKVNIYNASTAKIWNK
ncbi:DUF4917 family protein [Polaribacter vadi]|uniref:DUF4917 family protein n=1 Tax=Polaribacter TaxID=52959 RepID=UPI001C08A246|nr:MULTISPECIES: DUF4917 family protein [Polaribacter]MBU3011121.1 DUF4917 family protein [Polaribacter vadi]MDO6740935.1 DUF4917 family protein [Polaribacter sp. 1_MG-2023]